MKYDVFGGDTVVIFIANDIAVGVGADSDAVEGIVLSCDGAVTIGDGEYVAALVVGVADRILDTDISCDTAGGIVEILADLAARVGELLLDV